jgi:hypothetical protein
MKNKIILTFLLLLVTFKVNFAQDTTLRTVTNTAFKQGEKLTFEINYGFITAGTAEMMIAPNTVNINARPCYDITFTVNSSSAFTSVYRVNDYYKCYLDAQGLFPWRFEQHIKEGNYTRDFEALFDHVYKKVKTYTGEKDPKKFEGEFDIPQYVHDGISAFYYVRTQSFAGMKTGDVMKLQNFYNDKTYPLDVKYLGKETIEVPAGEFSCIKVQPYFIEGGLFKSEGDITVWLTDDDRKMPVKVSSKIIIGSVDVDLTSYSGLAGPLNSKK